MEPRFAFSLTRDPALVASALRLRREVFVGELGARADGDAYDLACDHAILRDTSRPEAGIVATARLARGHVYTAGEFDLSRLAATGRSTAEIGRTCLHRDYRAGAASLFLFKGIVDHLKAVGTQFLVGAASFPGADPTRHLPALRALRAAALAPEDLRPVATGAQAITVQGSAGPGHMRQVPSLIKTYLRAGAWVGDGAWVDHDFNTVDVCIVLQMARLKVPAAARATRFMANA